MSRNVGYTWGKNSISYYINTSRFHKTITAEASDVACGGFLSQLTDENDYPKVFAGKNFKP